MSEHMKRRAITLGQKRDVVERLLQLWLSVPELRLGQMLMNAVRPEYALYNVEDFDLIDSVKALLKRHGNDCDAQPEPSALERELAKWREIGGPEMAVMVQALCAADEKGGDK